jgi:hypothetical protein
MTLTIPLSCNLKVTQIGWWISFPHDSKAGILLTEPDEQQLFLADLGVSIEQATKIPLTCSEALYQRACSFSPPF